MTYVSQVSGTTFGTWTINNLEPTGYNITVDLTNLIKAWKRGYLINDGIRMRYNSGNPYALLTIDSIESNSGFKPVIEVNYVPEPATLGLLGLGGLLIRRRRA